MNTLFLRSYVMLKGLLNREEGQDLVEYALVVALIALGAVASMNLLATAISTSFNSISSAFAGAF